jgi:hypothetical protein
MYLRDSFVYLGEPGPGPEDLTGILYGGSLCSVRPVAPEVHDVYAANGAPLVRITRRTGRLLP